MLEAEIHLRQNWSTSRWMLDLHQLSAVAPDYDVALAFRCSPCSRCLLFDQETRLWPPSSRLCDTGGRDLLPAGIQLVTMGVIGEYLGEYLRGQGSAPLCDTCPERRRLCMTSRSDRTKSLINDAAIKQRITSYFLGIRQDSSRLCDHNDGGLSPSLCFSSDCRRRHTRSRRLLRGCVGSPHRAWI